MFESLATQFQKKAVGRLIHNTKRVLGWEKLIEDISNVLWNKSYAKNPQGERVLIFTYKWWAPHLAAEAVIGKALELRGARATFFVCDHPKQACDNFRMERNRYLTCAQCLFSLDSFLEATQFDTVTVNQYRRPEDDQRIADVVKSDDLDVLRKLKFDGISVGVAAESSTLRYLRINSLFTKPEESRPVLKMYLKNALETYFVCKRMFESKMFDRILLQCGKSCTESVMVELATRFGIPYVTYDFGHILGTMMFSVNESISDTNIIHLWNAWRNRSLNERENRQLDQYMNDRRYGRHSIINQWPDPKFVEQPFNVAETHAKGGRVYVLFSNVAWDTAASGIPAAFPSMFDWLEETIRFFEKREQDQLIIRIHPAEVQMKGTARDRVDDFIHKRFPNLPPNIRVVAPEDKLSSYSIIPIADIILIYTTTIGMESAILGKAVITAAQTHYANHGFTIDSRSREDYFSALVDLKRLSEFNNNASIVALARKYAYLFFFKQMLPFPYVEFEGPKYLPRLRLKEWDDLAPGRDPHLDSICDGILHLKPIFVTE